MAATFVNSGNLLQLKVLLGVSSASLPVLRLYTNNVTISATTVIGGVTECVDGSYVAATLGSGGWSFSLVSGVEQGAYSAVNFTIGTTDTIYGYYITDYANSTLLAIEAFSGGPYSIPSGGATITVTPTIGMS
jgi:hypothetical protein